MSRSHETSTASKSLLLRIEAVCDQYERDLRARCDRELWHYANSFDGVEQARVLAELAAVRDEYRVVSESERDAKPPRHLPHSDRFEYERQLGLGSSGTVWKARDRELDRCVAIKLSHPTAVTAAERFARESRVVARLQHPNIVRIHEVIHHDGQYALVCEYIDGETLAERMRRERMPVDAVVSLLIRIADALAYAHTKGVVHRDIKPQNILVDRDGRPHLTDFGLASDTTSERERITATGDIIGTPAFMAPEQAIGESESADPRTDVYSLGAVMFFLLTGDVPFRGSVTNVVHQVAYAEVPSPRKWDDSIPRDLETLCLRCLDKQPQRRFQSVNEFREELQRFHAGQPVLSRPLSKRETVWRWCKRHPQVASLLSAVFVLLLVIATVSIGAASRFTRLHKHERQLRIAAQVAKDDAMGARRAAVAAEKEAVAQAVLAQQEARASRHAVGFLQDLVLSSDPINQLLCDSHVTEVGDTRAVSVRDVLLNAAKRIYAEPEVDPLVQALLMDTMANACRGVGLYDEANRLLQSAKRTRDGAGATIDLAQHHFFAGWLAQDLGRLIDADGSFRAALELLGSDAEQELLRANIRFQQAQVMHALQRLDEAEAMFAESLRLRQKHLAGKSKLVIAAQAGLQFCRLSGGESVDYGQLAATVSGDDSVSRIAVRYVEMQALRSVRHFDEASEIYGEVVADLTALVGNDHPIRILALGEYAGLLWEQGDFRKALVTAREAVDRGRRLAPGHEKLRHALGKLGFEYLRAERHADARACFEENLRNGNAAGFDFESRLGLLWACLTSGDLPTAYKQSQLLVENRFLNVAVQTAWVYYSHARVLQRMGKADESRRFDELAIQEARKIVQPPASGVWQGRLAVINNHNGDYETGERLMRNALAIVAAERCERHPRIADRQMALAITLRGAGKRDEANELARQALETRQQRLPAEDPRSAEALRFLGELPDERTKGRLMLASGQSL